MRFVLLCGAPSGGAQQEDCAAYGVVKSGLLLMRDSSSLERRRHADPLVPVNQTGGGKRRLLGEKEYHST
jgi:hypothetical protein